MNKIDLASDEEAKTSEEAPRETLALRGFRHKPDLTCCCDEVLRAINGDADVIRCSYGKAKFALAGVSRAACGKSRCR